MAIKDQNVLDRINTLNTNLENNAVSEIERNISNSLFNVLEWTNGISIDPDILASVEQVSKASNLNDRIVNQRWKLATAAIAISYGTRNENIANTVVTGDTNDASNTQSRINENQWYIDSLRDDLPNQIRSLRTRLEENQRIVNNINRIQRGLSLRLVSPRTINTQITNMQNLSNSVQQLNDFLRRINEIETDRDYWTGSRRWNNLETIRWDVINSFNSLNASTVIPTGMNPTGVPVPTVFNATNSASSFMWYFRAVSANISSRLTELRNQLTWIQNIEDLTNTLPTDRLLVPNYGLWFWDSETVVNHTDISVAADSQTELDRINERLRNLQILENNIPRLRARYQENIDTLRALLTLQNLNDRLESRYPREMGRRHDEFELVRNVAINNLWLRNAWYQSRLPNQTFNIGQTVAPITLDFVHWTLPTGLTRAYNLCDRSWNPFRVTWGNIEIPLDTWTTIRVSGITFTPAWEMTVTNLTVTPMEWVTFPLVLDNLNVRVRISDWNWLNIDHHKPIRLEITSPVLTQRIRQNAYDSLRPPMNERVAAEYSDHYRENIENDAIWRILREWWNEAEVNEIYNDETRRRLLQDRMRTLLQRFFPANALTLPDLQTRFRTDMTRINRDVPAQYLLNGTTFADYVRNSIPDKLRSFVTTAIYDTINRTIRTQILQELVWFQADVANNRVDNFDNLLALQRVPWDGAWPQWHPNNALHRVFRHGSRQNNYTKFFQWREATLDNLSLETEDWVINYGVHVEVTWVNKITAAIQIEWKDEPEIIDAANHDRLITWILNRANTKDGEPLNRKLRCNMALSVLKAMIMMSPQSLRRQIPPTDFVNNRWQIVRCDRIEADIRDWNLVIRWAVVDPARGLWWPNPTWRTRRNVEIFNETSFKNLHDVDMLRDWVHQLSMQINTIMNATAQEYNDATNTILRNKSLRKYNTTQFLRFWPVKRLWGRIAYWRTNTDFDFDTSVSEAWKDVHISFNKWKFTVTWEFDGQQYQYQARDLWLILRKKINRKRVFDGVELAMVAAVNEEYIQRLRTNNLVQTENFAVADFNGNKTWRVYIFDAYWDLSYLEIEDRRLNPLRHWNAGRISARAIPTERIRCNDQERREFMQNPFLAWRLQRAMRRRLALF